MKQNRYNQLVDERKKYHFQGSDIVNPSKLGIEYDEHLNAWAYWHGNLNADILLIGQDFGDIKYYRNNKGKDEKDNQTNVNLTSLFNELGIDIGTPDKPNTNASLYFTNAVLGAKVGGMSKAIKKIWYSETAIKFTKPLIEIIDPKIIIALGSTAYDDVCRIYKLTRKPMKEIINQTPIQLPDRKKLFVVYHCSNLGIANRNFKTQLEDWRLMKSKL